MLVFHTWEDHADVKIHREFSIYKFVVAPSHQILYKYDTPYREVGWGFPDIEVA